MEIMEEEHPEGFTWKIIDVGTHAGIRRLRELRANAGGPIPVPSILADGAVIFDAIPDLEDLDDWLTAHAVP